MYQPSQFGPEFAIEEVVVSNLKALGFEDVSWGNNITPSFARARPLEIKDEELVVTVWVDAKEALDREYPLTKRFMLDVKEEKFEGGRSDIVLETDDFWELLRRVRIVLEREKFPIVTVDEAFGVSKRSLAVCYEALIGYDPFKDNPAITAPEVANIIVEYLNEQLIEGCY